METESIIQLNDVKKSFQSGEEELMIFQNVSFSVNRGDSVVITGESGCGKSTLLNLIGGLDRPSGGSILSCGYNVDHLSEKALTDYRSFSIGFIFQFHYLLKDFNALENIMLPALMAGTPRKKAGEKAAVLIEEVGLNERSHHFPSQLSGGERQRIAMARALINDPELILADEPTGNLDERNSRAVEKILFNLVDRHNKTLILVTHDPGLSKTGNRRFHLTGKAVVTS